VRVVIDHGAWTLSEITERFREALQCNDAILVGICPKDSPDGQLVGGRFRLRGAAQTENNDFVLQLEQL
jgi:hypothetical protein